MSNIITPPFSQADIVLDDVTLENSAGVIRIKDNGVSTLKLKTGTGSLAGTLNGAPYFVTVTMNAYSFFPTSYYNGVSASLHNAMFPLSSNYTDQIGRFAIWGDANDSYSAHWRYVNASDKDHWIFGLKRNGVLCAIWESEDHPPVEEIHPFAELEQNDEVVLFDDSLLSEFKQKSIEQNKSISQVIFDDYIDDKEMLYIERNVLHNHNAKKIKKSDLGEIKYKSLKIK